MIDILNRINFAGRSKNGMAALDEMENKVNDLLTDQQTKDVLLDTINNYREWQELLTDYEELINQDN